MADSNAKDWVTFLTSAIGGGAIALVLWFVLKDDCNLGPLKAECVHLAGQTMYGPAALMTIGTVLGFAAAFVVEALRSDD